MAKIGIITYHRATNYGAVLQAYSLVNRLKKDFPNDTIEIIDYSTSNRSKSHVAEIVRAFIKNGFKNGMEILKKINTFASFSNELPRSKKKIVSNDIKTVFEFMNSNYDIVITGSDAVFNWGRMPFPTAYLLGEDTNCTKFSYAASCHRLFYRELAPDKIEYCKNSFSRFSYIGVRDKETESFVKYCLPDASVYHNCDPTFFIDIESINNECKNFDVEKIFGIKNNRPLIIVMSPDKNVGNIVMERFSNECNVVSLFVHNAAIPHHCSCLTPFEWANVFKYAAVTVTEYFHATIFSLLNGTPTVTIDKLETSSGYEGKIHDLLCERLNLPEFYINIDDVKKDNYKCIAALIEKNMTSDFSGRISTAIQSERSCYDDFKNALTKTINDLDAR